MIKKSNFLIKLNVPNGAGKKSKEVVEEPEEAPEEELKEDVKE